MAELPENQCINLAEIYKQTDTRLSLLAEELEAALKDDKKVTNQEAYDALLASYTRGDEQPPNFVTSVLGELFPEDTRAEEVDVGALITNQVKATAYFRNSMREAAENDGCLAI